MRALVYTGAGTRRVELPSWVEVDAAATPGPLVRCTRCGVDERLAAADRTAATRALGRFASFHARCAERLPYRPLRRYAEPVSVAFVRRR